MSFILSDYTSYVQALDIAINKPLKDRIDELANISYDRNVTKWEKESYLVRSVNHVYSIRLGENCMLITVN